MSESVTAGWGLSVGTLKPSTVVLALSILAGVGEMCVGQTTSQTTSRTTEQPVGQTTSETVADEVPGANPARPTVATPATLTPVGYLQFENGVLYATGFPGFSSRLGANQVTKLTVHPRLEFLVQSEPFVHSGLGPVKQFDPGDVLAGFQGVLFPGEKAKPTVAVSYFKHVYAGTAPDIDIGTPEHSLLVLVSNDMFGFHFDINGWFNEQKEDRVRRAQFGQTVSVSHPLKKFTIATELWHFTQPLTRGNAVGSLWCVSYPFRKNLVVDAGFNRGLTGSSVTWQGFAGFTYLLPHKLWK